VGQQIFACVDDETNGLSRVNHSGAVPMNEVWVSLIIGQRELEEFALPY